MNFPSEAITNLRGLGYTEREAGFLYIVAIHSGYFTQSQVGRLLGQKPGRAAHSFTSRLLSRKHARERKYQNNASVYHLTHRRIYQAIERENLRNRRSHTFEFMKARLAILDFVLGHLQYEYLESETEKVPYFERRFGIRPQDMPGRAYRGANQVPDTIRHFVDKFPMFLDPVAADEPVVTFTFIDPGAGNLNAFHTHLAAYASFLGRIPRFGFVFASPNTRLLAPARKLFEEAMSHSAGTLSQQLARYFTLRANWEAKRYELLKDPDIEFMNSSRQYFASEAFESAFAAWKAGHLTESGLGPVFEGCQQWRPDVHFRTYLLPRDYSSFGQNSAFTRKSA